MGSRGWVAVVAPGAMAFEGGGVGAGGVGAGRFGVVSISAHETETLAR
jgi:hypothetical protein